MKYYKVGDHYKLRRVADKDVDLVPSHWTDVSDKIKGRPHDTPNVKFDKTKKTTKKTK
tara:strand:- start:57 stop:230 length:174 start_codon:yes stop_codon:yes gene_type:complete